MFLIIIVVLNLVKYMLAITISPQMYNIAKNNKNAFEKCFFKTFFPVNFFLQFLYF